MIRVVLVPDIWFMVCTIIVPDIRHKARGTTVKCGINSLPKDTKANYYADPIPSFRIFLVWSLK